MRREIFGARVLRALTFLAAALLLLSSPAPAQSVDSSARVLKGSITLLQDRTTVPKSGAWVIAHRFGAGKNDSASTIDSVRTSANGEFVLTLKPYGDPGSLYFLSSVHAGIAYFTDLWRVQDLDSADANIVVFDTTRSPVPYSILARRVIVWAPVMSNARRVVENYQVANDTSVTAVATDSSPVWRTTIPDAAREFATGPDGANLHSLRLVGNEVQMMGAFAPGVQDIVFSYELPQSSFPLPFVIQDSVDVLEVVLDEPLATVTAPWMIDEGSVNLLGRTFGHVFRAQNVAPQSTLSIAVPAGAIVSLQTYLLIVVVIVGAGMLIALAVAFNRKVAASTALAGPAPQGAETVDSLARQIAALDDMHASRKDNDEKSTAEYNDRRTRLKMRLAVLLARGTRKS